jgi:YVTN family beta-propeller protein
MEVTMDASRHRSRRGAVSWLPAVALAGLAATASPAAAQFVNFESQHVHPIAQSSDGARLYVVNTPDSRLSAFDLDAQGQPTLAFEVPVGLEPVSVAVENPNRVWVVNHLGDSISIVDVSTHNVVATVRTGDEPTDVLFTPDPAHPGQQWAWVCASQEDRVQVFDAETPGRELLSIAIFGSDPRAMAYDPVRQRVYVAVFESGSPTTIVPRALVHQPQAPWGGQLPPFDPPLNPDLAWVPDNGVIVRWTGTRWLDEQGGDWTPLVPWRLADNDVIRIDLDGSPGVDARISGVGTLLFDIAVAPTTGDVYVTNTEALNHILFEPKLRGRFVRNRITRIPGGTGAPIPQHLNDHIVYTQPGTPSERALSLSQPGAMAIRADGQEIYFTAHGSALLGVANAQGQLLERRPLAEGATGLALHEGRDVLYIVNRFTNRIHLMRASSGAPLGQIAIGRSQWDPTPPVILAGRRFLYAAAFSGHGDAACASCHPFANFDNLAWDLGDPAGSMAAAPPPEENGGIDVNDFHPLKGPMTTLTLRGLEDTGFLHWRGDREDFNAFNGAFVGLLGGPDLLPPTDMQAYSDFIMTVRYPPNPFVLLDNTLSTEPPDANAATGAAIFTVQGQLDCDACHTLPTGTNGLIFPLDNLPGFGGQVMKVPQTRNMYEKTGFDFTGQNTIVKRGFGFTHDGGIPTLAQFLAEPVLQLTPAQERHVEAFLLSFPNGTAAAVGHQLTLPPSGLTPVQAVEEIAILEQQAVAGGIDLVVKGIWNSEERGFLFDPAHSSYRPDRAAESLVDGSQLAAGAGPGAELTWLGLPPLTGVRVGIDRDLDGALDRDELDAGSDPADPASQPTGISDPSASPPPAASGFLSVAPNPFTPATLIQFAMSHEGLATVGVYDAAGRRVRLLVHAVLEPGEYKVRWDGRGDDGRRLASGAYFLALRTAEGTESWKVSLVH